MRIFYIFLFCLPLFLSCEMKKDLFGGGSDGDGEGQTLENVGMLSLRVEPEKEASMPGTKGDEDETALDAKSFAITILDSLEQVVRQYDSYSALEEEGELLLPAGLYAVKATLGTDVNAAFDSPYYAGDTTCVISAKEVAEVVANCRLQNKKVQFKFSDDFFNQFQGNHWIVVDNGTGVLSLSAEESRIAYFKNTGTLRFTLYATTYDSKTHSYSVDLSADTLLQKHNNVFIELGAESFNPETPDNPNDPDTPGGDEPEEPDDPEEPDNPDDDNPNTPEYPAAAPTIKVDVTLIEKDYVIEIPSDFVDSDKPNTGGDGDDDNSQGGNQGGDSKPSSTEPAVTGTINGKAFDVNTTQTVTSSTKSVVINLYLPTGLNALTVRVIIGESIDLPLDLLNAASLAEINSLLTGMGKELVVPAKGAKGNLKFDISPFLELLDTNNSFKVTIKDKNGKSATATIKLTKK